MLTNIFNLQTKRCQRITKKERLCPSISSFGPYGIQTDDIPYNCLHWLKVCFCNLHHTWSKAPQRAWNLLQLLQPTIIDVFTCVSCKELYAFWQPPMKKQVINYTTAFFRRNAWPAIPLKWTPQAASLISYPPFPECPTRCHGCNLILFHWMKTLAIVCVPYDPPLGWISAALAPMFSLRCGLVCSALPWVFSQMQSGGYSRNSPLPGPVSFGSPIDPSWKVWTFDASVAQLMLIRFRRREESFLVCGLMFRPLVPKISPDIDTLLSQYVSISWKNKTHKNHLCIVSS